MLATQPPWIKTGSPDIFVEGDRAGAMHVADRDIGGIGFG
jgi:hypothetical protein